MRFSFLTIIFCLIYGFTFAQKQKPKKIRNINADKIEYGSKKFRANHLFTGKVIFEHQGTKFYCDSAVHFGKRDLLLAWGNVKIKNDTILLKGDSLRYNGKNRISEAWNNVKLKDKRQTITADYMQYNRNNDVALAKGNVVVVDKDRTTNTERVTYNRRTGVISTPGKTFIKNKDGSTISSERSVYNSHQKTNEFIGNVRIVDKDYIVTSNKVKFNQITNDITFSINTKIVSRENPANYIISDGGVFNKESGVANLTKRSTVYKDGKELHADKLRFNEKTGIGIARGNVWINDPEENQWIKGDYGESYEQKDSAFVTGNAYAVKAFEKDSLYFHADTILAVQKLDSTRLIRGYRKAKFYKSNVQGKADSISYNETTGRLNFFRKPIVWSGDQQITGDTIYVYSSNKNEEQAEVDSIRVFKNAFVISKVDSIPEHKEYNQVKGRQLLAIFRDSEIRWVEIEGNSQSLTFMEQEKKDSLKTKDRIGINRSDCGIIEAQIRQREVDILACKIDATSILYPEKDLPEKQRYLPDFNWRGAERMRTWNDLFVDHEAIEGLDDIDFGEEIEKTRPGNESKLEPKKSLNSNAKLNSIKKS